MTGNRADDILPENDTAAGTTAAPKSYVVRGLFIGATLGCLAGLLPLALLLIDLPILSLQTGIGALDSFMYSAPGTLGLWIAGAVWGSAGAGLGGLLGMMAGVIRSAWT